MGEADCRESFASPQPPGSCLAKYLDSRALDSSPSLGGVTSVTNGSKNCQEF